MQNNYGERRPQRACGGAAGIAGKLATGRACESSRGVVPRPSSMHRPCWPTGVCRTLHASPCHHRSLQGCLPARSKPAEGLSRGRTEQRSTCAGHGCPSCAGHGSPRQPPALIGREAPSNQGNCEAFPAYLHVHFAKCICLVLREGLDGDAFLNGGGSHACVLN